MTGYTVGLLVVPDCSLSDIYTLMKSLKMCKTYNAQFA